MTATAQCISPIDGSLYAERPLMSFSEGEASAASARRAQPAWAARSLDERVALVREGIARLDDGQDEAVTELAWMMGRPVRYGGEFGGVRERASHMATIAESALRPLVAEESDRFERRIVREPLGVVLTIAPWNYPYMTAVNSVAPALIAGNAVILKHATQTLLAGERMVRAFTAAGVPPDVMQNVFWDHQTTLSLIAGGGFDFVNFTGSVDGGRAVERAAAGVFIGVNLELGGKDPAYVMEDADVESAAALLTDAAMYNSGQCCCGIERVYVAASLYESFVDAVRTTASDYVLGDPLEPSTTLGPMAHRRFAAQVRAQIAEAENAGAKLLLDAKNFPADDGGVYLAPQVLVDVNHDMRLMREESFGPVVGIMPVRDDDEAVLLMNDSDYGLTATLCTNDLKRAEAIGSRLQTGTVFMNRADYVDPALCWSGRKNTGRGGALSEIGYHCMTRPKSYHFKKL